MKWGSALGAVGFDPDLGGGKKFPLTKGISKSKVLPNINPDQGGIKLAIEGKKKVQVYVDEANYEYVKSFIETTRFQGGMSGFFDSYLGATARTLRSAKYVHGKKLTMAQLLRFSLKGLKADLT